MLNFLTTVLAVVLGGAITLAAEWVRARLEAQRRLEERQAKRDERLREEQEEFQRATLLRAQECTQSLVRTMGQMHMEDVRASREAGRWFRAEIDDEVDQRNLEVGTELMLLTSRIRDARIRELLDSLRRADGEMTVASSEEEQTRIILETSNLVLAELHDRIGRLLRGELPLVDVTADVQD